MKKVGYNSEIKIQNEDNIKKLKPIIKDNEKTKENTIIKKFNKISYINNNLNKSQSNFFQPEEIRVGIK